MYGARVVMMEGDFNLFNGIGGAKPDQAYIFAGAAPGPGVPATEQFLATINRLEQMQQGVEVRVVSHPFMDPTFWDRVDRLAARRPGDPHPFVGPGEFGTWIAELKQVGIKRLADAKAKAASSPN